jgi:hypothetical protein
MMTLPPENFNDGYYHIGADVEKYPDAVVFLTWSRRGPGKTYSALRYPYHKFKTLYLKRTNKDVKTICEYDGELNMDPSPWVPLNRDFGINVKPRLLKDGFGAFYDADQDGHPTGPVVNYVASLNAIKTIKGMDLSDAEWIIFDEFIPQAGEVVKKAEGEMLLNLFETVNRDRRKRGRPGLKLILFANAEEISTHITNALEVVDTMAEMQAAGINILYDEKRRILFHHITTDDLPMQDVELQDMYQVMQGTAWAEKSFGGMFSSNDFSAVKKQSLKHMRCLYHLKYRRQNNAYIYLSNKTGCYYMSSHPGSYIQSYDLDRENQQKKFYFDHVLQLREACIEDRFLFERYSYYDLIINYTKFYDI